MIIGSRIKQPSREENKDMINYIKQKAKVRVPLLRVQRRITHYCVIEDFNPLSLSKSLTTDLSEVQLVFVSTHIHWLVDREGAILENKK